MSGQISQCELCQQRYHLFRRKKQCDSCGQIFCSKCAPKSTLNSETRSCLICLIIIDQQTTDEQLQSIDIRHLRAYLIHSRIISTNQMRSLVEKQDLIRFIQSRKRPRISDQTEQTATVNISTTTSVLNPVKNPVNRITLNDLSSFESIESLTIGQLKDLLQQNFVSSKGCLEKQELISKVQILYRDYKQINQKDLSQENLCKVCMDAGIDCVFLDCGHMCTCIRCGKQLSECPFCRSYIVRVVRVFKT